MIDTMKKDIEQTQRRHREDTIAADHTCHMTEQTLTRAEIDEYVDAADSFTIDSQWLQTTVKRLRATYETNATLRSKHAAEPLKFLESEEKLDKLLIGLCNVTQSKTYLFDELVDIAGDLLIEMFSHPNEQITDSLVQLFTELFDPEYQAHQAKFLRFVIDNHVDVLIMKLTYNKDPESPRPELEALDALTKYQSQGELMEYLVNNENLFTILNGIIKSDDIDQSETAVDLVYRIAVMDTRTYITNFPQIIDTLLIQINKHRSLESRRSETYVEAIAYLLGVLLSVEESIQHFLRYEGPELVTRLLETGRNVGIRIYIDLSIHLIDDWFNETIHLKYAEKSIKSNYFLKNIFNYLKKTDDQDDLHKAVKFLARLAALLPFGSTERLRFVGKVTDKDFKNLKLLNEIENRFEPAQIHWDDTYEDEKWNNEEYFASISDGLEIVQKINVIKAWLLVEDEKLSTRITSEKLVDLERVKAVVKGYRDHFADDLSLVTDDKRKAVQENELESLDGLLELL